MFDFSKKLSKLLLPVLYSLFNNKIGFLYVKNMMASDLLLNY